MRTLTITLVSVVLMTLAGCGAGEFTVVQKDNTFSENKNPVFVSSNNRISTRSLVGGSYIDDAGLYIDPFVEKNVDTGKVENIGFLVMNKASYDTTHGDPNAFGILQEIVFRFPDGDLLTLPLINKDTDTGRVTYNTVGAYFTYDVQESGIAELSAQDFAKLASATAISAKVTGSRRSMVYEQKYIAPSFLANIHAFYEQYVR